MFVTEIFNKQPMKMPESAGSQKQVKVIYPGRFQPFHKGHKAVYDHLCQQYGKDNVYICTSNKVEPPKSPFSFDEKTRMMALTGIDLSHVAESTQPYRAMEIVKNFDAENTILIFAISEKDMAEDPRFKFAPKKDGSPSYFQPFKDISQCEPLTKHGYMTTVPTFGFEVLGQPANSATQIRAQFAGADEATQKKIVTDLFGRFDPNVLKLMQNKLAAVNAESAKFNIESIEKDFGTIYPTSQLVEGKFVNVYNSNWKLFNHLTESGHPDGINVFYEILSQKMHKIHNAPLTEDVVDTNSADSIMKMFDSFKTGNNVKQGDIVSVIELSLWHLGGNTRRVIHLDGFISPKEVESVEDNTVYFNDGSNWPNTDSLFNQSKFVRQTIIFNKETDAQKCLMSLMLFGKKLNDWEVENHINEGDDQVALTTMAPVAEGWKQNIGAAVCAATVGLAGCDKMAEPNHANSKICQKVANMKPAVRLANKTYRNIDAGCKLRSKIRGESVSELKAKALTKTMHENAKQGNVKVVMECIKKLMPIVEIVPTALAESIAKEVTKAVKVADRNRDDIFEAK